MKASKNLCQCSRVGYSLFVDHAKKKFESGTGTSTHALASVSTTGSHQLLPYPKKMEWDPKLGFVSKKVAPL